MIMPVSPGMRNLDRRWRRALDRAGSLGFRELIVFFRRGGFPLGSRGRKRTLAPEPLRPSRHLPIPSRAGSSHPRKRRDFRPSSSSSSSFSSVRSAIGFASFFAIAQFSRNRPTPRAIFLANFRDSALAPSGESIRTARNRLGILVASSEVGPRKGPRFGLFGGRPGDGDRCWFDPDD